MAAPYVGLASSFYTDRGTSTQMTAEAMTQVGSSLVYYITARAHAWLDPAYPVTVKDSGSAITTGYKVDLAGGFVTLLQTPSGAVTLDGYYRPMEQLGGGFGFSWSKKGAALETTVMPGIAGTLTDKTYIGSGIVEWTATLKRHFYYAKASRTTALGTANANLTWTWKGSGSFGNDEAIKYESGGALQVTRAANETVVTYETGVTLASAVKAHVEADPVLAALWDVSYPVGNDGSGVVGDVAHIHCTGGRDSLEQLSQVATKVLAVMYLENAAATSPRLEGVGIITDLNVDDPLEAIVESDLSFQGDGALCYHAV